MYVFIVDVNEYKKKKLFSHPSLVLYIKTSLKMKIGLLFKLLCIIHIHRHKGTRNRNDPNLEQKVPFC